MLRFAEDYWYLYLAGLGTALIISAVSIVLAILIGTFGALGRTASSLSVRFIAGSYVAGFRSFPPLLTLYLIYFGLPSWAENAHLPMLSALVEPLGNRILAAVIAFTLTSGAYATEIIRAGIAAVPEEQWEAARSIGMSQSRAFRRIVAPQAFRIAFAPLGNEYLALLKATSLASVIGVVELMRTAQIAAGITFQHLIAYSMAGTYYVVFVVIMQLALQNLERRLPGGSARPS
jgi:His/Glu/Gln/Arg/opine family amino acid ABC transporter permease subunit